MSGNPEKRRGLRGIASTSEPTLTSVTIDPWRSVTRHVCSIVGCDSPCTDQGFAWRVTQNERGEPLPEPRYFEAFFCEQHETDIRRLPGMDR